MKLQKIASGKLLPENEMLPGIASGIQIAENWFWEVAENCFRIRWYLYIRRLLRVTSLGSARSVLFFATPQKYESPKYDSVNL